MNFEQFALAHGVIVGSIVPGKWMRFPTQDKPRSRNGAIKFMGDFGLVQNWATMVEPAVWRSEGESREAVMRVQQVARQAAREATENARKAAQKAATILGECELSTHPYLASKGFPDEVANVWSKAAENILCIPMRASGEIVGCQMVTATGDKKFLYGQRSGGAEFVIGRTGVHVLCEGYATGLSVRKALASMKLDSIVHVGFSAGNLLKLAATLPNGIVIADNDESKTGERIAREIGWPYWISEVVGEDANDAHQRMGTFRLGMALKRVFMRI